MLADIKTFEQHKVYGVAVNTGLTLQTERVFYSVRWEPENEVLASIDLMLGYYNVAVIKIGIVENMSILKKIIELIAQKRASAQIIWDTVIKSSSGFDFWNNDIDNAALAEVLSKVYLITPNYDEAMKLIPGADAKAIAQKLSGYCNVLLKGGHNEEEPGVDYLYTINGAKKFLPTTGIVSSKHGSGCVLSAAIAANVALGFGLSMACKKAKNYIEQFLNSNQSLLGYHHV